MAADKTAVAEAPAVATPHPSERMFASDHPELATIKTAPAKKSAFMDGLDSAIEAVVPEKKKEESKEVSTQTEQPVEVETTPAEEQPVETETTPVEVENDKVAEVSAADETRFKDYAEKNGITEDEAKAEIEEYEAIAKKYDNDPIKIAKAYKNIQSTFDKQKANDTQAQQARLAQQIMTQGAEEFVAKAEKEKAHQWIADYRKTYPAKSEMMTDAAIVEECRQIAVGLVKQKMVDYQDALKRDSTTKREQLLKTLPAEDRAYVSEISRMLKNLPDADVVQSTFNFEDLVRWARGDKKVLQKIKDAEYQRGFKAAKSGDIVGEIVAKPTGGSKPRVQENKPAETQLSNYEKNQALAQYASLPGDDEAKFAAFLEVKKEAESKNREDYHEVY